jgi:hypothetical protein
VIKTHLDSTDSSALGTAAAREPDWLVALREQVGALRSGVVQIERTEKVRFDPKTASAA